MNKKRKNMCGIIIYEDKTSETWQEREQREAKEKKRDKIIGYGFLILSVIIFLSAFTYISTSERPTFEQEIVLSQQIVKDIFEGNINISDIPENMSVRIGKNEIKITCDKSRNLLVKSFLEVYAEEKNDKITIDKEVDNLLYDMLYSLLISFVVPIILLGFGLIICFIVIVLIEVKKWIQKTIIPKIKNIIKIIIDAIKDIIAIIIWLLENRKK